MEKTGISVSGLLYSVIVVFTLVVLLGSIPFGTLAIFSPHLSTTGLTYQSRFLYVPMYIGLLTVDLPLTPTVAALFLSLTSLYVFFIALAAYQGGGMLKALRGACRDGMGDLLQNPLTATIMILGATLLATIILDIFQTSAGVSTGGLSGDPYLLLVDFTLAPLIEEVGFRFFLIGVPLFVVLLLMRSDGKRMLKALWRPSSAWEAIPADSPMSLATRSLKLLVYVLIAVSSIVFGVAHYVSGAGWGIGKISEAALDGVALAYLYVRYGLHASIIFHWAVDFASNGYAFYGQAFYGISYTANSIYSLVPTIDIVFLAGIPALLFFINLFIKRAQGPHQGPGAEPGPSQEGSSAGPVVSQQP